MNNSRLASRQAFSLMELLVTVSILALLLGLIVPVFSRMRDNARIASDKVTAKNLETAFRAYLDYYKEWPAGAIGSESKIEGSLYKSLTGDNPDSIVFYEFSNTNSPSRAVDAFWDPGEPDNERVFRAKFDKYDSKISLGGATIRRPVIVWSVGPNGKNDQGSGDDITSW